MRRWNPINRNPQKEPKYKAGFPSSWLWARPEGKTSEPGGNNSRPGCRNSHRGGNFWPRAGNSLPWARPRARRQEIPAFYRQASPSRSQMGPK